MLFNSHAFLFIFLPLTWIVWRFTLPLNRKALTYGWLVVASLAFYGYWKPSHLILIAFSIMGNYPLGRLLSRPEPQLSAVARKRWVTFGVTANLAFLAVYKYTAFAFKTVDAIAGTELPIPEIVAPLGISFITFQQIAYLVDASRGQKMTYRLLDYTLFVTFFPRVISGPIVYHGELLPQFDKTPDEKRVRSDLAVGLTIFAIGLFKKTVIADGIAPYADSVFGAAGTSRPLELFEAWAGALAYTFQLYFDFSGYADMAIGSSRMFGILLPLNFDSPYKSVNVIELWRRWHMTLSRFLRDYLYIPLGGNRHGRIARFRNLWLTMLLGGLWHGAGWTFVLWGGLHGFFLIVNHSFIAWRQQVHWTWTSKVPAPAWRVLSMMLTFTCFVVAVVVFRGETLAAGGNVLAAMFGAHGARVPNGVASFIARLLSIPAPAPGNWLGAYGDTRDLLWCAVVVPIIWGFPSTQQWLAGFEPALGADKARRRNSEGPARWAWKPTWQYALVTAVIAFCGVLLIAGHHEFVYFKF
jgi:alginate O-acetyltransferase complex protein AlgI